MSEPETTPNLPEPESNNNPPTPEQHSAADAEKSKKPGLIKRTFTGLGGLFAALGSGFGKAGRKSKQGLSYLKPSQPTLMILFLVIILTTLTLTIRKYFLQHVPSGHMLVVVSKFGSPLSEGQILAVPGQQGIREEVLGEGWHFVWPVLFETEIKQNFVVPGKEVTDNGLALPKVGIVKALGGTPLPPGEFLADKGQQGIWREVLLPGAYRLNPYGYEVKLVDMVEIKAGFVGVLRRKLGVDGPTEFASKPTEKGILKDKILQPGLYPINTEVYEVIPCPVGIYQTTYHYDTDSSKNTALIFDASDSNRIQIDCTIEWELKPQHWPVWLAKFRNIDRIESAVVMLNVKNISRNKGQDYGAEDFLDGTEREQFQADFSDELERACNEDNVIIRHAFIRNIIIPDTFLKPKREEQIAKETTITQKELNLTAETFNEVVAAERTIDLEVGKVEATTEKLVAVIDQEITNINTLTSAELEKLKDEYAAKIAILDAERDSVLGIAKAEAATLVETAKSGLHRLQMEVFEQDPQAFLRYTMSQSLNPALRMRLYQSGPGTFWTNMGDKNMNLMVPTPTGR